MLTKKTIKETIAKIKEFKRNCEFDEADVLIYSLIKELAKDKNYLEIVKLLDSNLCEEEEIFYCFDVAYALAAVNFIDKAEKVYEHVLVNDKNNSAALNNLSLIKKQKGEIKKAFDLIRKAKKLDPESDITQNNYEDILNILNEQEALKQNYKNALNFVKQENEFVVNKLKNFILNSKKDQDLKDNKMPIPNWKFRVLMGTDEQKAESLKNQWLDKLYIRKTGQRVDNFVMIYEINPYLEYALEKAQNTKINQKWIDGFESVTIESLENIGYFEILQRIKKINKKYKPLIERDFSELVLNYLMKNEKAVVILAGSLIEVLLIYYCEKKRIKKVSYQRQNKSVEKDLYDCNLGDLLSYFEQMKIMGDSYVHMGNISRIHRNFIHPGKELKDIETLNERKSSLCFISTIEIIRKIV